MVPDQIKKYTIGTIGIALVENYIGTTGGIAFLHGNYHQCLLRDGPRPIETHDYLFLSQIGKENEPMINSNEKVRGNWLRRICSNNLLI